VAGGIAGTLLLIALIGAASQLVRWAQREMHSGVDRAMSRLLEPEASEAERRRVFIVDADGHPTGEELDLFARAYLERYGPLSSVSIVSTTSDGGEFDMTASAVLRGRREEALATIRFRILASGAGTDAALLGVEIHDRSRSPLAVGRSSERSPQRIDAEIGAIGEDAPAPSEQSPDTTAR